MKKPVVVDAVGTDRDRLVKLVAVGLVLAVLLLLVPRLLSGGADGAALDLSTTASSPAVSTTTTTIPGPVAEEPPVAESAERNPFAPLGSPSSPAAPPPGPTTTVAPPPAQTEPERIELVDVYTDPAGTPSAKVRIDGTQMTVKSGEDFATSFRTLSLDLAARCGAFLYADTRFSLCVGEGYQL